MQTELSIPSDLRYIAVVEHWLLESLEIELKDTVDWQTQSSRLRLALVEAYSNVVRHAHKSQADIPIVLKLTLVDRTLALEIWDSGEGFNIDNYNAPTPSDFKEGGYGWLIIRRLMDKVEYKLHLDGRNCLQLEVNLPAKLAS